jgi:hypothetical protein
MELKIWESGWGQSGENWTERIEAMKKTFAMALIGAMVCGSAAYAQSAAQPGQAPVQRQQDQQPANAAMRGPADQTQNRATTSGSMSQMSGERTAQPGNAPNSAAASGGKANRDGVNYVTRNDADIWRASKLDGVAIYNEQNEKIGDISDVLIDRTGTVRAVVIGVGGFLGLGERNVAVSFDSLRWQLNPSSQANAAASNRSPGMTTGTNQAGNSDDVERDYPAKVVLPGASKEQLKNAPEFRYAS